MSKLFPTAVLRTRAPYRFDIVGSFLRPEALKQARRQCACGECSMEAMHTVEDAEIHKIVEKQKAIGLPAVSDGEFRRTWWHLDFLFELIGVELRDTDTYSTQFKAHMHRPVTLEIIGKIQWPNVHPFLEHYKRLHAEADVLPLLDRAAERMHLSMRSYQRILKVARSIADLAASPTVNRQHLAEALQYRSDSA